METATLKSFATRARTDLLKEVSARVAVVLAENSLARVESAGAVHDLEQAIARDGQEQLIDRVAYTWFNRIVALRFMDANGYTLSGVVSPSAGQSTGQPEVLAEAKAGVFDSAVVPVKIQETITALFNGTRQSQDRDGEAYGLLLEAYCRSWHKAMPFMFEREGDYTELLIPAALLAQDSVRDRAVKTLTEEVCRDVEVIGWLYQFYISERKAEVFEGFKKNTKAGAAEIPAATQLFTPHWIVRYLVENSLGRLWLLNNPQSRLGEQMEYYIGPVDEEPDFLRITTPEELKIIDPAVGSGHMLTYAFDLLHAIYTEKGYDPAEIPGLILEHNLYGTEIDLRAGALAAFALSMKAAARRKLFLKNPIQPNICVLQNVFFAPDELDYLWSLSKDCGFARGDADEFWNAFQHADTLGSLIQPKEHLLTRLKAATHGVEDGGDLLHSPTLHKAALAIKQTEYLSERYLVAIANPPYMGTGNTAPLLARFAAANYPASKSDLFAMFIERCGNLASEAGFVAMITMQSWMFLGSFEGLRGSLLRVRPIKTLAHLGSGAFDSIAGDVVATCAFVLGSARTAAGDGIFLRLTAGRSEEEKSNRLRLLAQSPGSGIDSFRVASADFRRIDGAPIAYWLSPGQLHALLNADKVGHHATLRKGLVTLNDGRFTRRWFEVGRNQFCSPDQFAAVGKSRKWYPLNKGGGSRRWYGFNEVVINWENHGKELKDFIVSRYGGGSYSKEIRSEDYYFQENVTWGAVSSGTPTFRYTPPGYIFSSGGSSLFMTSGLLSALAVLNSESVSSLLKQLTPTMNFVSGDVGRMPFVHLPELDRYVLQAIDIARDDWDSRELSWDFRMNPLVAPHSKVEDRLSQMVAGDDEATRQLLEVQNHIDDAVAARLGLDDTPDAARQPIALFSNVEYEFGAAKSDGERSLLKRKRLVSDLVSYAVGCMLGRYSLDEPGLILADQGSTLEGYRAKVPTPSFMPDQDNVIPIVDGDWFEDDIVARFRTFLRASFGEEHFEENLRFVTDSLGVKDVRDYFVKSFYDDHVKRYRKRPIYWLFRSPKGSFSALIYLHRYTPSTASTVLTGYLREFIGKLEANLEHQGRVAAGMGGASARDIAAAQKEADRIRKVLVELRDYEHDVLFPLAGQQIALDLDDGVLVNYQKLGAALKDIGLKKGGGDE